MATQKRYKVKKQPLIVLGIIVVIILIVIFARNQYKQYVYHNSTEYKLLEMGYKQDDVDVLKKHLSKERFDSVLEMNRNKYISGIVKEKYFMEKNLDRYLNYLEENNNKNYNDVIAIVNINADKDWYEDATATDLSDGYSILVNKYNYLEENYEPENIESISSWYAYEGHSISSEVYSAYKDMWNAAKNDGHTLIVFSSYRTYTSQKKVYDSYENTKGQEYADSIAARPGHSEHQTGLALDIMSYGLEKSSEFVNTETYKWLLDNAHNYGFILRFPEGKEYLTGYNFESWHYRYLGKDLATKVYNEGITYDEYYAYYLVK